MFPVCVFLARLNVLIFRGDDTKYWALVDLGIHLGNLFPSCSLGFSTYAGHNHGWSLCRALWDKLELVKTSSGYILLLIWVVWLCNWTAWSRTMGQRIFSLASFHFRSELIIVVLSILTTLFIAFSAAIFWWWPPTPLFLIPCTLIWIYMVKSLEMYILLSV